MGSIKFKVHPLFFVLFLYEAIFGNYLNFTILVLTAVIHELGHSFCASKRGYELNRITITPFGALVSGSKEFDLKDQAIIALCGPLLNFLIGLLFVAFWWIAPEIYAYTDVIVFANFSMAIINLLPCFPLDGGRVLYSIIAKNRSGDVAFRVCKILGFTVSAIIVLSFFITLKNGVNISILLFGIFAFFGAISVKKENKYVKIYTAINKEKLLRGMPFKKIALHKDATVKTLLKVLDQNAVNEVSIFDDYKEIKVLSQEKLFKILETANYKSKLSNFLND